MCPDIRWEVKDGSGQRTVVKTVPKDQSRRRKIALGVVILLGVSLGVIYSSISEPSPRPPLTSIPTHPRAFTTKPLAPSAIPSLEIALSPSWSSPTPPPTPITPQPSPTIPHIFSPDIPLAARRDVWRLWRAGIEPERVGVIAIRDNLLWAGTLFSLTRFDLQTGSYNRYPTMDPVRLFLPLENGQALATVSSGVLYFDGQVWNRIYLSHCSQDIDEMLIDAVGDLWLLHSGRFPCSIHLSGHIPPAQGEWLEIFDTTEWNKYECEKWPAAARLTWISAAPPNGPIFAQTETYTSVAECQRLQTAKLRMKNMRTAVTVDANQGVWYADGRVLWHVNGSRTTSLALPGVQIYALAADPWHGIWAGTDQGLAYSDATTFDYPVAELDTRLFYGTPQRMAIDPKGAVWVNLHDNGEVRSFSDAIPRWRHVKNDGSNVLAMRAIAAAPTGGFWATDGWNLWKSHDPIDLRPVTAAVPPCQLHDLVVDRQGHVWSPTHECGALEYSPQTDRWKQHRPEAFIEAVSVAPNGRMYLLGQTGLYVSSTTSDWPMILSLHEKGAGRLLAAGNQDDLWLASRETGELWHYANGQETALGQQFPPQGLSALYATDRLWAIDRNTLALYAAETWRHIPTPMLGNISQLAGGSDNRVWLMGDRGVAVYDPAHESQP